MAAYSVAPIQTQPWDGGPVQYRYTPEQIERACLHAFALAGNPYLDVQLPGPVSPDATRPLRFEDCHSNVYVRRNTVTLGNGETFAVMPGFPAVNIQYDGVTIGGHRKYALDELGATEEHVRRWIERIDGRGED